MKKLKKFIYKNIKPIIISLLVIGLFIFTSWFSHRYAIEISGLALTGFYGEIIYVLLSFFGTLIAGVSSTPLIPLALAMWGVKTTVFLTAIGWTTGSLVAFLLARRYGEELVCRLVNVCDLEDYKHRIKSRGLFWKLFLARVFLPVDILSYAVGLFTKMPWPSFVLATFLGSAFFTLLAVYVSNLSVLIQVLLGVIMIFIFFVWAQKFIKNSFNK